MDRVRPRTNWRPAACDQHQDLALGLGGLPGIERCLDRLLALGRRARAFASAGGVHHHVAHWSEQVVWIWECAQFLSIALSGRYSGRCAIHGRGFFTAAGDNRVAIGHIRSAYSGSKAPRVRIEYRHLDDPLRHCGGNRLLRPPRTLPGECQLDAWSKRSSARLEDPDPTQSCHSRRFDGLPLCSGCCPWHLRNWRPEADVQRPKRAARGGARRCDSAMAIGGNLQFVVAVR